MEGVLRGWGGSKAAWIDAATKANLNSVDQMRFPNWMCRGISAEPSAHVS